MYEGVKNVIAKEGKKSDNSRKKGSSKVTKVASKKETASFLTTVSAGAVAGAKESADRKKQKEIRKKLLRKTGISTDFIPKEGKTIVVEEENILDKVMKWGYKGIYNLVMTDWQEVAIDKLDNICKKVEKNYEEYNENLVRGFFRSNPITNEYPYPDSSLFLQFEFVLKSSTDIIEEVPILGDLSKLTKSSWKGAKKGIENGTESVGRFIKDAKIPFLSNYIAALTGVYDEEESTFSSKIGALGRGIVHDGIGGTIDGVMSFLVDPIGTVESTNAILAHPEETMEAIQEQIDSKLMNGTPEDRAEIVGQLAFEILTIGLAKNKKLNKLDNDLTSNASEVKIKDSNVNIKPEVEEVKPKTTKLIEVEGGDSRKRIEGDGDGKRDEVIQGETGTDNNKTKDKSGDIEGRKNKEVEETKHNKKTDERERDEREREEGEEREEREEREENEETEVNKGGVDATKLKGAKGLFGKDFEDYLTKNIGGEGSFSVGGRDFDGGIGNRWWEAKSGPFWENRVNDPKAIAKFKSDMGDRLKIAKENGATYELFSNTPIPKVFKDYLDKKGIPYTEILE